MSAVRLRPESVEELAEAVRGSDSVCPDSLDMSSFADIVELHRDDQVVVVGAGMPIDELNRELALCGQCLPIADVPGDATPRPLSGLPRAVGEMLSFDLPHALEGQCGSWRDWVLGMTVVLADGTIAKSGSRAVKSVAGYDVHKLVIGSRRTLAIPAAVILRTYPIGSLPQSAAVVLGDRPGDVHCAQRVLPEHLDALCAEAVIYAYDPASSVVWHYGDGTDLTRYPGDRLIRFALRPGDEPDANPFEIELMRKAKSIFDATGKLCAGAMGIF